MLKFEGKHLTQHAKGSELANHPVSSNTLFRMCFHIVRPSDCFCVRFLPPRQFLSCSRRNSWSEHVSVCFNDTFVRLAFALSASQIDVAKKWCLFSKIDQFHQFLQHGTQILLISSQFWSHPRIPTRTILVFDERKDVPKAALFSIQVPTELPRTVFPTRDQQIDVRINFVQEEPLDLQCLTMILAICVVEDVSIYLDILTLEFWAIFGVSSIFTIVYADMASAACPSQSGSLALTSITFATIIWGADEPFSVNTA